MLGWLAHVKLIINPDNRDILETAAQIIGFLTFTATIVETIPSPQTNIVTKKFEWYDFHLCPFKK